MNSIVVHYQEIALKGKNRPWFMARLVRNLRHAVSDLDVTAVRALMGRIEIVLGPAAAPEVVGERIRRDVRHRQLLVCRPHDARSRRDCGGDSARPRRSDVPQLPRLGAARRQALSADVAAGRARNRRPHQGGARLAGRPRAMPSWSIHVELLTDEAFYFFGKERGAGGLPTGTAGRVACLLSGGIDSPVAAHRMMKRGCAVTFVHFHSYPILSRASQEKARELVHAADHAGSSGRGCTSCRSATSSSRSCSSVPGPMRVVVYRRLMMRIAERIARARRRAGARDRRRRRTGRLADAREPCRRRQRRHAADFPAADRHGQGRNHRRGAADRDAIRSRSFPDQDCCTLFTPRNPLTRARLADIEAAEQALPIEELVERAVRDAVVEEFEFPGSVKAVAR